ncbi:hypothetical protein ACTHPF_17905 [Paenibacillus sp. SAF-054]|uniref:hypothetical protein n=1 Tax=unclassified Paenibacillus TaxID=185978 RepID=UPI003F7F88BA
MNLQTLYHEYINIKFERGLPPVSTDGFEYCDCEDGGAELFVTGHACTAFSEWISELQPRDPHYTANVDWEPVLSAEFPQLSVYDELVFYYLLFTVNATTSIVKVNPYNAMNDFMKNYCFFQLSRCMDAEALKEEQRAELRDFFLFFYLYTHPVNEETLYSFSFRGKDLVHTTTDIAVKHYFTNYYDHYRENPGKYREQLDLSPPEIDACKSLSLELLKTIEGKSSKLTMPAEEGLEDVLQLINNVDDLMHRYSTDKAALFKIMADFLADHRSSPYRDHAFRMLIQNYATYILYFDFDEIHSLVDYFKAAPLWCGKIINAIFADAIFIQKIMRQQQIDITKYDNVTHFFNETARSIYL